MTWKTTPRTKFAAKYLRDRTIRGIHLWELQATTCNLFIKPNTKNSLFLIIELAEFELILFQTKTLIFLKRYEETLWLILFIKHRPFEENDWGQALNNSRDLGFHTISIFCSNQPCFDPAHCYEVCGVRSSWSVYPTFIFQNLKLLGIFCEIDLYIFYNKNICRRLIK